MTLLATEQWEYITGTFGMVGVVLTLGAILVALFGPSWRAKKQRPKLTLSASDVVHEFWDAETQADHAEGFIELTASEGRDTADGVEIYLSIARPSPLKGLGPMRVFQGRRLCFDSFQESEDGQPQTTVPAGFVRRVPWVAVGWYRTLWNLVPKGDFPPGFPAEDEDHGYDCAVVNLYKRSKRTVRALDTMFGGTYYVYLTVTGANFDALSFSGVLEVSAGAEPMAPDDPDSPVAEYRMLKWTHSLAKTSQIPQWVRK